MNTQPFHDGQKLSYSKVHSITYRRFLVTVIVVIPKDIKNLIILIRSGKINILIMKTFSHFPFFSAVLETIK